MYVFITSFCSLYVTVWNLLSSNQFRILILFKLLRPSIVDKMFANSSLQPILDIWPIHRMDFMAICKVVFILTYSRIPLFTVLSLGIQYYSQDNSASFCFSNSWVYSLHSNIITSSFTGTRYPSIILTSSMCRLCINLIIAKGRATLHNHWPFLFR